MEKSSICPPSHSQIDRLLLASAASGGKRPDALDMLVHYIRALRDKGGRHEHYISPETKPANDTDTSEELEKI